MLKEFEEFKEFRRSGGQEVRRSLSTALGRRQIQIPETSF
jgi:hypothetical protein